MAVSTIKPKMFTKTFTKSGISASTYYSNQTVDITQTGYTPKAVVSYGSNQALANLFRLEIVGNTLNIGVSTIDKSNLNNVSVSVQVLYV